MCKSSHNDFDKLFHHFKHSHNLNSKSPVRCVECGQLFALWLQFKRHVTRHHLNRQTNINNDNVDLLDSMESINPLPDVNIHSVSKTIINESATSESNNFIDNTIENTQSRFNVDANLKTNIHLALQFFLILHNNDNFSRKDVMEIQEYINQYIITPILDTLMNFAKSTFQYEQPTLYNNFSSLVSNLKNPFKLFN